jgi:hypothetical protein
MKVMAGIKVMVPAPGLSNDAADFFFGVVAVGRKDRVGLQP